MYQSPEVSERRRKQYRESKKRSYAKRRKRTLLAAAGKFATKIAKAIERANGNTISSVIHSEIVGVLLRECPDVRAIRKYATQILTVYQSHGDWRGLFMSGKSSPAIRKEAHDLYVEQWGKEPSDDDLKESINEVWRQWESQGWICTSRKLIYAGDASDLAKIQMQDELGEYDNSIFAMELQSDGSIKCHICGALSRGEESINHLRTVHPELGIPPGGRLRPADGFKQGSGRRVKPRGHGPDSGEWDTGGHSSLTARMVDKILDGPVVKYAGPKPKKADESESEGDL